MAFEILMKELDILQAPSSWERFYPSYLEGIQGKEILPSQEDILDWGQKLGFPQEMLDSLVELQQRMLKNPPWIKLWGLWRYILFKKNEDPEIFEEQYQEWPLPPSMSDQEKVSFRVLVLLSNYLPMSELLLSKGLGDHLEYTKANFAGSIKEHHRFTGNYGLSNDQLWWIWAFMLGHIFRIGLLEYEVSRYSLGHRIYRHRDGHQMALCCQDNLYFDKQGYQQEDGAFHPSFLEEKEFLKGCSYDSSGLLDPKEVILEKKDWKAALTEGDYVLNVHIPGDQRLDPALVRSSMEEAPGFFQSHFPEIPYKAIVCYTWLLDSSLKEILGPKSNILFFQEQFSLIMNEIDEDSLFDFIFECTPCPIEQLVPKNEFQKKILQFVKQKGGLRGGFGYILQDLKEG